MVTGFTGKCTKVMNILQLQWCWCTGGIAVPYCVEKVELLKVRLCNGTLCACIAVKVFELLQVFQQKR